MDRGIFVSVTGANAAQKRLSTIAENLANSQTPGFQELLHNQHARYVVTENNEGTTRVVSDVLETGKNHTMGPITDSLVTHAALLDSKQGFLMQRPDGTQYASRNGAFTLNSANQYQIGHDIVLDNNGNPLSKSAESSIQVVTLGIWTEQGFKPGEPIENARVQWGKLEGSNVNSAENLLNMISSSRSWDLQMQMIKKFDENEQKANTILGN